MKRIITAFATAAILSVSSFSAAFAAEAEMTMVIDTVTRLLIDLRIPSEEVNNLTLDQARRIIQIADSAERGDPARIKVLEIINE